jgi:hypothetical protein
MSLSASSMKSDIIEALRSGADTAANANKKFGDAILRNICENITVQYSWAGTNPSSGATDPATSFTAKVSGSGTLTPSPSFPAMLLKLAILIKALTITPATGFSIGPLAFNPAGVLTVVMARENTQEAAIEHFCIQLIASIISSFPNPAPASGSHTAFTGATTGMVIA